MADPYPTRWTVLGILGLIIAGAVLFGPDLLARIIRERSLKIMEQAAGPRSQITIGNVNIQLLPGDITWNDLRIEQRINSADTSWTYGRSVLIAGKVDRIAVKGLSIWRLLTWKTLEVRSLAIQGADLELISSDRKAQDSPDDEKKPTDLVNTIAIDSLTLDSRSLRWRKVRHDRPSASTGHVVALAQGLRAVLPHGRKKFSLAFNSASATVDSTKAHFPPLYDLSIAHLYVAHPDSMVRLKDIALTSRKGPQEYGKVIPYETDLITFTSDTIGLHGLDFSAMLNEGSLRAGEARVCGTQIIDFRDKTLKDAPFSNKPMPARLLRQLPFTVCLDSLVVDDLGVEYNEKADVTEDFGQLTLHPHQRGGAWHLHRAPGEETGDAPSGHGHGLWKSPGPIGLPHCSVRQQRSLQRASTDRPPAGPCLQCHDERPDLGAYHRRDHWRDRFHLRGQ